MANLKVVFRGLSRSPLFAAVAIVSLALGIGVNTAIFSLLDQVLLRTLPVPNPHELVYLYHPGPVQGSSSTDERDSPSFSYPMFRDLQKAQTPFTGLGASRGTFVSLSYQNNAAHGRARMVSGNYFDVLGVKAALGRVFTEEDDRLAGAHPLVVLGHRYWRQRFGSNPSVLNQTMIVNGQPLTIVGVAQNGFGSESLGNLPDVYVPISMDQVIETRSLTDRQNYWVTLFGRMKPGMTRQSAEAEINIPYRAGLQQDEALLRQPKADFLARFRAKKIILKEGQYGRGSLRDQGRAPLQLLMGLAVLVLLIACANVANLQLARSTARAREMAIRLAMGASRAQLIRQLLTESCLIALAGGVLGLFAARWTIHAIIAAIPPSRGLGSLHDGLDMRVLFFSLAISMATGILFGLFPALQASKASLVTSLKDQAGQISASGASNAFRSILATAQVAISLMLLICAGLFGKTLVNLSRVELGIKTDHLMTFSLLPVLNQYTDQRSSQFYQQLIDRLEAVPGAQMVTASASAGHRGVEFQHVDHSRGVHAAKRGWRAVELQHGRRGIFPHDGNAPDRGARVHPRGFCRSTESGGDQRGVRAHLFPQSEPDGAAHAAGRQRERAARYRDRGRGQRRQVRRYEGACAAAVLHAPAAIHALGRDVLLRADRDRAGTTRHADSPRGGSARPESADPRPEDDGSADRGEHLR